MKLRNGIIGLAALIVVGALVLFQFRGHSGSAGGQPKTLTVAGIAYPYQGGQAFADLTGIVVQQGWLKDQLARRGVALNFTPIPTAVGGPLINEGFSGKRIDFAAYGDFPAIIAVAGGVPLKLVAPVGVGRNVYLVVGKGSTAQSIADLKGKRIALHRGRPWELSFSKLLEANGLKESDFTIVNINPSATPAALASGDVDAAVLLSDALLTVQKGTGRVIWSTKSAPADWRMRAELFGRGDFVQSNPTLTQLVVDAYIRADAWAAQPQNRAAFLEAAARGTLPVDIVTKDYDDPGISWRDRFSPLFNEAVRTHYRSVADYTYQHGLVRTKVDANALLDDRFVTQALQDLKLDGFWTSPGQTAAPAGGQSR